MPAPVLLDLTHTCHTQARTGVQRVARSLLAALGADAQPVTHDPFRKLWRELEGWELRTLAATSPGGKRGARWPLLAQWRGRLAGLGRTAPGVAPRLTTLGAQSAGLLVPEIFSTPVGAALPALFRATRGPRIAVFHDAIALKYPELTPAKTVARFPGYLVELLAFDGIAAVSEDSRDSLIDYWRWLGAKSTPPVRAIPLGVDPQPAAATGEISPPATDPVVLCVGSIEGRKNHLALLEACEGLWAGGARFTLHLVGLAQPQTAAPALERIRTLQAAGRPLRYDGPVPEAALTDAYRHCAFTVYPSRIEGFGLPVLESIAHGRPCICSARGALGESARGGGCVALERTDAPALGAAIARLLDAPDELSALTAAARRRELLTWDLYARDVRAFFAELGAPRRA